MRVNQGIARLSSRVDIVAERRVDQDVSSPVDVHRNLQARPGLCGPAIILQRLPIDDLFVHSDVMPCFMPFSYP